MDIPYAIFGHSMGTLLGYLLAQRVLKENLPPPLHLFFSGREGPSIKKMDRNLHLLPKKDFIEKLKEYDGSPEEVLNDEAIMEFFEPILRADIKAHETYVHRANMPLDVPMTVMIGTREKISPEEALAWQAETTQQVSIIRFSGGHFFIFNHWPEIGEIFSSIQISQYGRSQGNLSAISKIPR